MENKELKIEELRAQIEELEEQISVLENEEDDVTDEEGISWKKPVCVVGGAVAVGVGALLVAKKPWQAAKVVQHIIHIV